MKILAKLLPLILSGGVITASNADVPHTFSDGGSAVASEVNENFSYLEERINSLDSLQSGDRQEISVDCSADTTALAKYLHWDSDDFGKYEYTTFLLTGTCDGPIYIYGDGVRLQSADDNSPATLRLPAGVNLEDGEFVVMADGAQDARLIDLVIDVSAYTSSTYEDEYVTGVLARTSLVRIVNSDIIGGIQGVNAFRNAIVRFEGENSVTDFFKVGVSAGVSSHIEARGFIMVEADDTISNNWVSAINIDNASSARINSGSYINFPNHPENGEIVNVGRNSVLQFSDGGTDNNIVEGSVWVGDGGFMHLDDNTTINGNVYGRGGAVVDMRDNALINGEASFQLNSVLDMESGSEVNGSVEMRRNSSLRLDDAKIYGDLNVRSGSSATLFGGGIDGVVKVRRSSLIHLESAEINGDIYLRSGSSVAMYDSNVSGEVELESGSSLDADENSYIGADLDIFLGSSADIGDSTIGGEIDMFSHASLNMKNSQSGFINANSSTLNVTGGSVFAGGNFYEGTFVHIGNSSTTADILSYSNTSSIFIHTETNDENGFVIVDTEMNFLDGNTLYMCQNEFYLEGFNSSSDVAQSLYGGYVINACP